MLIDSLFAAKPVPFGPRGAPSAIQKLPVDNLTVYQDSTKEDEQGNKKLHGGPEKVLHQFSFRGYDVLRRAYPDTSFNKGSIGENMLVEGMDDTNVYIGDVYKVGDIVLQVSAPRAPCNKISHRYGVKNLDRFVGNEGITGWYYRVLKTGTVRIRDTVSLVSRPENTVSIAALMQAVYDKGIAESAAHFVNLEVLDDEWRQKCERVLKRAG
ncbi:MOSC domain-containing protein [Aestuariibacter sp. A3R04]|uniref:MOSC domain-containing protein n=1 Tax=Aestuariibacter sp. A3R04 TaxID=2841571 RepID=UPI001C08DC20|nr:MOSC domain-containing protein [Aestuariibacter sp. A3R04]MBU3023613.1 MOSC domain-containing protein [Aestuariibacter sp. A3R04]